MEIRVDPYILILPDNISLVRLREREGERVIDISLNQISLYQLLTIINEVDTDQPIIHKLMVNTLLILGTTIEKVVVDDLVDGALHSRIYVKNGERIHTIDANITDAIGLAVVQDCPLLVLDNVFKKGDDEIKRLRKEKQVEISDEEALRILNNIDPSKLPS